MTVPKGWTKVSMRDASDLITKGTTPTTLGFGYTQGGIRFVKAESLRERRVDHRCCAAIDERAHEALQRSKLRENDVLITIAGTLGRVARVLAKDLPANTNQAVAIIRPKEAVDSEFLCWFLQYASANEIVSPGRRGTGLQNLNLSQISAAVVPIAPLFEQRRIVVKLDALMARLARARAELDRVLALSRNIRRSTLEEHFSSTGHETIRLEDVLEDIRYGTAKKCEYGDGTPVLRIPNIQSGRITTDDLKSAEFDQPELEKLSLRQGDVLVIRSNGSRDLVGKSAVVGQEAAGMLYAGYLIRLRVSQSRMLPDYLHSYLSAPSSRVVIEDLARSTSGVNNINAQQLKSLVLPLPTLDVQRQIVSTAWAAFARADRLEAEAARARALLDRLESAILAKAFKGELVPQDPNDEPASALLERIRAQRAETPKRKRA